jgi:NADH-quinone oxidoreductase subunit J
MHPTEPMDNNLRIWALLPSGLLAVVLGGLLIDAFGREKIHLDAPTPNPAITNSIFRVYLVPFEVVGVLLLAALIGAVVLARKD